MSLSALLLKGVKAEAAESTALHTDVPLVHHRCSFFYSLRQPGRAEGYRACCLCNLIWDAKGAAGAEQNLMMNHVVCTGLRASTSRCWVGWACASASSWREPRRVWRKGFLFQVPEEHGQSPGNGQRWCGMKWGWYFPSWRRQPWVSSSTGHFIFGLTDCLFRDVQANCSKQTKSLSFWKI